MGVFQLADHRLILAIGSRSADWLFENISARPCGRQAAISENCQYMQRRCRNRDCQLELPPPPFMNPCSLYCSEKCRKLGLYTLRDAAIYDDPIAAVNEFGLSRNAFYARFGTRNVAEWRFFPAKSVELPLSELPALPRIGAYRVQLFDVGQVLIRDSEMRIYLPVEWIRHFCRFTDGGRSSTKLK